jgi:sugar phosphate isomerase/epimerase
VWFVCIAGIRRSSSGRHYVAFHLLRDSRAFGYGEVIVKVRGRFHLTYCSNIHPAETWAEVLASLETHLPAIRRQLSHDGPFGIGLRLSAAAAEELERPEQLARFREFLARGNYYVFTINGFPYGAFHGQRVKEQVYLPDWRDERRLAYSNRLARILASLLPAEPHLEGSVSTVPGAFKSALDGRGDVERIADMLLRHVTELVDIRERTGRTIVLALEPEPACMLETTPETIDFFQSWLFGAAASRGIALDDVQRHLGVCYDACHMAVQFEEPAASVASFVAAGIKIAKIQVSSGLHVSFDAGEEAVAATLAPFSEGTYLHQVVERHGSGLSRYVDLPEALASTRTGDRREWRVHFHLPIYLDRAPGFDTTHDHLLALFDLLKHDPFCPYLEVETYTWSVLAPEYRTLDLPAAIARELAWVRDRMQ